MRRKVLILAALALGLAVGLWSQGSAGPAQYQVVEDDKFQANATGDLTLTITMQDVPGLSRTLADDNWKIEVCVLFSEQSSGDEGQTAAFRLLVDGTDPGGAGVVRLYDSQFQTTCFNWLIDTAANDVVKVQARKSGGTGQSKVLSGNETSRMIGTIEP